MKIYCDKCGELIKPPNLFQGLCEHCALDKFFREALKSLD